MAAGKSKGNAGSLFYGMTLATSDFSAKLKAMRKLTRTTGEAMQKTFKNIAKGSLVVAGAFTGIGTALSLMTKETAKASNEQFILAKSIGATVTEVDALTFAANTLGVESGMLIDKMREAGGIDAFKDIADQVAGAGTEVQQMAKAQELLGNEGLKLLPILQQGSAGLAEMEAQALKTGNALPTDQVAALVTSWKSYEGLMHTLSGMQRKLSAELALPVAELFNGLDQITKLISTDLISGAKAWATFITNAIPVVAQNVFSLTDGFITFANQSSQGVMLVTEALFGLESGGKGTIGIFQTMGDLLATLPNQVLIVLKKVGALMLGTFRTIGNLFFRAVTEPIIFAMKKVDQILKKLGGEGFDLESDTAKIRETFSLDIAENISDLTGAGGLLDITKIERENERIIAKRVDSEEKFSRGLKMSRDIIKSTFDSLKKDVKEVGAKTKEAVETFVGMNERRAGAILTGSQEEARILSGQSDKNLKVQQETRDATRKTNQILMQFGTV